MTRPFVSLYEWKYRVILISGKARSGKDSLAKVLSQKYGFVNLPFAGDLKNFCAIYFGVPREDLFGEKTKFSRLLMQGIGIMFREQISSDYWVRKVEKKILKLKHYKRIVISDCRFMNELTWGIKNGCFTVKVVRENCPQIEANPEHSSETDLDRLDDNSWDWIIINREKRDWRRELEKEADNLIKTLVERGWFEKK